MQGTRQVAERMVNAQKAFVQLVMEKGFTRKQAEKIMTVYLKNKIAKLDAAMGRITVKHGAFWELDVLRNAANL